MTTDSGARKVVEDLKIKYHVNSVGVVENNTHGPFGAWDILFQVPGHELGGRDVTAVRVRDGARQAIKEYGRVYIWAHSQGTAVTYAGVALLTPAERSRVVFVGNGSQQDFPKDKFGFRETFNLRTERDKVAYVSDALKFVGLREWKQDWIRIPQTEMEMNWLGHDTGYYIYSKEAPDLREIEKKYAK